MAAGLLKERESVPKPKSRSGSIFSTSRQRLTRSEVKRGGPGVVCWWIKLSQLVVVVYEPETISSARSIVRDGDGVSVQGMRNGVSIGKSCDSRARTSDDTHTHVWHSEVQVNGLR